MTEGGAAEKGGRFVSWPARRPDVEGASRSKQIAVERHTSPFPFCCSAWCAGVAWQRLHARGNALKEAFWLWPQPRRVSSCVTVHPRSLLCIARRSGTGEGALETFLGGYWSCRCARCRSLALFRRSAQHPDAQDPSARCMMRPATQRTLQSR